MPLAKQVVYIAGPITNKLDTYQQAFAKAEAQIKNLGAIVLNPSMLPIGLKSHKSYMNICLPMVREAEAMVLLDGWEDSAGAKMEAQEAQRLGMPIYEMTDTELVQLWGGKHVV